MRGTPQQIIDKYNQLARDSQLSGDRVATENFQQHAEHYTRMLAEAMREQEARREAQEAQHRERQQQRNAERNERQQQHQHQQQNQGGGGQPDPGVATQPDMAPMPADAPQPDPGAGEQPAEEVIDVEAAAETGLVETPESKPAPKRRRSRKKPDPKPEGGDDKGAPEAAE